MKVYYSKKSVLTDQSITEDELNQLGNVLSLPLDICSSKSSKDKS